MKTAAITFIFILVAFAVLGYVFSELTAAQAANARLAEALEAAQAALATTTAEGAMARAERQVYQQVAADLGQENAQLRRTVQDLEAALADQSLGGAPAPAALPGCRPGQLDAGAGWEAFVQSAIAAVLTLVPLLAPPAHGQ